MSTTRRHCGWVDGIEAREAAFCRISQMGLLRLLTNVRVMERAALTQAQAWQVYGELHRDERVSFLEEPQTIEQRWRELTRRGSASTNLWTDCYLRAFAELRGLRIVTFDRGFASSTPDALLLE